MPVGGSLTPFTLSSRNLVWRPFVRVEPPTWVPRVLSALLSLQRGEDVPLPTCHTTASTAIGVFNPSMAGSPFAHDKPLWELSSPPLRAQSLGHKPLPGATGRRGALSIRRHPGVFAGRPPIPIFTAKPSSKPASCASSTSDSRSVLETEGVPLFRPVQIKRYATEYADKHSVTDLVPRRREPFTRELLVDVILGAPHGFPLGSFALDWGSRAGRSLRALTTTLAQTGFRKGEVSVERTGAPSCSFRCVSRHSLRWLLRGRIYTSRPPAALLRDSRRGDFAVLVPRPEPGGDPVQELTMEDKGVLVRGDHLIPSSTPSHTTQRGLSRQSADGAARAGTGKGASRGSDEDSSTSEDSEDSATLSDTEAESGAEEGLDERAAKRVRLSPEMELVAKPIQDACSYMVPEDYDDDDEQEAYRERAGRALLRLKDSYGSQWIRKARPKDEKELKSMREEVIDIIS
ncbi:MAG: hypothetical protein SGPRY_011974, partial [Prymnesium sp.]